MVASRRSAVLGHPTHPSTASCFTADPLRVLRAVRFASRFGFELEERLLEAAADDEVRYTNVSKFEGLLRRAN